MYKLQATPITPIDESVFFVTIFISFLHAHVIVTKHSYNIRRKKKDKKSPPAKRKKKINRRVIR